MIGFPIGSISSPIVAFNKRKDENYGSQVDLCQSVGIIFFKVRYIASVFFKKDEWGKCVNRAFLGSLAPPSSLSSASIINRITDE
jgi:hypothetical protein